MVEKKNNNIPFDDRKIEEEQEKIIHNTKKDKEKVEDNFFDYLKRKKEDTQK